MDNIKALVVREHFNKLIAANMGDVLFVNEVQELGHFNWLVFGEVGSASTLHDV